MPKILITEPCLVNYGDDRGGVDEPAGALVEVPKAVANTLNQEKPRPLHQQGRMTPPRATCSPPALSW